VDSDKLFQLVNQSTLRSPRTSGATEEEAAYAEGDLAAQTPMYDRVEERYDSSL